MKYRATLERRQDGKVIGTKTEEYDLPDNYDPKKLIGQGKKLLVDPPISEIVISIEKIE